ncbi:hypothetical protein BV20DRAFT_432700 [Pilatotrama ljubarskyi]|nr:hypothetical protein BV20DRAFT_432700 [Pilatotrama ljubarskyi]
MCHYSTPRTPLDVVRRLLHEAARARTTNCGAASLGLCVISALPPLLLILMEHHGILPVCDHSRAASEAARTCHQGTERVGLGRTMVFKEPQETAELVTRRFLLFIHGAPSNAFRAP